MGSRLVQVHDAVHGAIVEDLLAVEEEHHPKLGPADHADGVLFVLVLSFGVVISHAGAVVSTIMILVTSATMWASSVALTTMVFSPSLGRPCGEGAVLPGRYPLVGEVVVERSTDTVMLAPVSTSPSRVMLSLRDEAVARLEHGQRRREPVEADGQDHVATLPAWSSASTTMAFRPSDSVYSSFRMP